MSLMKKFPMKNKLKVNVMITDKIVAKQFKIWARKKFKGMPVIVGLFLIWENLF